MGQKSFPIAVGVSILLLVVASLLSIAFGSSAIGPDELWNAIATDSTARQVLFSARLPRLGFALGVGAILATSGAVFQTLLRNPLADPFILGVSGGAALGATVLMSLGTSAGYVGALAGALSVVGVIALVAQWTRGRHAEYAVLLTGVMINAFCGSVILTIRSVISAQKSQEILFFLIGSLDVEGATGTDFFVLVAALAVTFGAAIYYARDLDLMGLGSVEAASLGVDVPKTRAQLIVIASLGVALVIPFTGLIGFVGLIAPHFVRLLVGPSHLKVLPLAALVGGAFLTLTDVVARVSFHVFATALPVGAVTAVIGAPLFLWFLKRSIEESS